MFISLGGDWGLSSHAPITYEKDAHWETQGAYTAARLQPDWRLSAAVGWTGFLYKVEPGTKKMVKSGDSDNDGIPDSIDKCPMVPEDWDGFEDQDGCPDYDNDKDGIADSVDECPDDPEDYDGFKDKDGCPDPDNDRDGICDPWVADQHREDQYAKICTGVDKCPNLPEDFDGFEDQDGCPDYDNDLDGVPDSLDRCPNEPGPADNQGCPKPVEAPKVKEIKHGRLILRGVEFKGDLRRSHAGVVSETRRRFRIAQGVSGNKDRDLRLHRQHRQPGRQQKDFAAPRRNRPGVSYPARRGFLPHHRRGQGRRGPDHQQYDPRGARVQPADRDEAHRLIKGNQ